jgi:uncharacterized protein YjiK
MVHKIVYLSVFLLLLLMVISCNNKEEEKLKTLTFLKAEEIPVPEPSGIDLTYNEEGFWIVSDQNSKVYLIDSWGKEVRSFKVNGEDLEGITVINDSTLAVVLERSREVVILDTSGKELKRAALELEGELNSGLEGITYNQKEKKFYVVNEKKPQLLIILDKNLAELRRDTLKFSKDVSGIFFDDIDNTLWILSDESQRIFRTDLSGNLIEEFKIKITQPEGITLNKTRTKFYIVSDKTENLYVFDLE